MSSYADVTRRDLFHDDPSTQRADRVSQRARIDQVCELVAEGLTNDEIALRIGVQTTRVNKLLQAAYQHAGITGRKHATKRVRLVLWYLRRTGRLESADE